jgi:lipopolysaccharide biosynthesis glycosyltransferase
MKYNIVTSCTPQYLPGLIALKNSIDINFSEAILTCFWYSQGQDIKLPEGIKYIKEVPMKGHITDDGKEWRHGLKLGPDMYVRLHIAEYFKGRAFYVDVDCIVLKNISEAWHMDMKDYITACVYRPDIGWVGGNRYDDMASGTFMADCDKWNEINMLDKLYDIMKNERNGALAKFGCNVESVMSYAHNGEFLHLPAEYQNLTYYGALCQQDKIAHFAAGKPWHIKEHRLNTNAVPHKDLWQAYYNKDLQQIKQITERLPEQRKPDAWPSEPHLLRGKRINTC